MLNIFRGTVPPPDYRLTEPAKVETMIVSEDTMKVRPLVAAAILRDVTFTQDSYDSFIALQDKLHQNLARQRTLVAIGTHDLDTIQGPFTYEALKPADIKFAPLNQSKEMTGDELMAFYEKDKNLGKYLPIIRDSPVYPVIYDANRTVLSLPPVINGDHSKISTFTKNILIEMTATDATKLDIVAKIMATSFSVYCGDKFSIEPVKIVSDHNGQTRVTPSLEPRHTEVEVDYLNACTGLSEPRDVLCKLLDKMAYVAKPHPSDDNLLSVAIPPTRADVLHQCDVMEDLAICYGYNNLPRSTPNKSATIGAPLMINKLTDIIREEAAMSGWREVMPLILCSHDENFAWLNRKDDGTTAVRLENPKSLEYQVVRTSLLPGLLKTIRENTAHAVPIRIFEAADVVFKDDAAERKARNERHFAAAWYGKSSGFEMVHGLLDRVLLMLKTAAAAHEEGLDGKAASAQAAVTAGAGKPDGYWIDEVHEDTFFPGRGAAVWLRVNGVEKRIGEMGILHPTVLEKFGLKYDPSLLSSYPLTYVTLPPCLSLSSSRQGSSLTSLQIPRQRPRDQPRSLPINHRKPNKPKKGKLEGRERKYKACLHTSQASRPPSYFVVSPIRRKQNHLFQEKVSRGNARLCFFPSLNSLPVFPSL